MTKTTTKAVSESRHLTPVQDVKKKKIAATTITVDIYIARVCRKIRAYCALKKGRLVVVVGFFLAFEDLGENVRQSIPRLRLFFFFLPSGD